MVEIEDQLNEYCITSALHVIEVILLHKRSCSFSSAAAIIQVKVLIQGMNFVH